MNKMFSMLAAIAVISATNVSTGCRKGGGYGKDPDNPPVINAVVKIAAGDSAGIILQLNEFRDLAGDPLNSAPGATLGRREVNWDAVPANFTNAPNFPFNFFGASDPVLPNARKRGLILTTAGEGFRVDSSHFSGVDNSYIDQFNIFSQKRLFSPVGTNRTQVSFKVAGTDENAFVKAFAVVFCDVDLATSATIKYYNGTKSLGIFKALPAPQKFSFLGVRFPDEKVTLVKIISGSGYLAAGVKDISNGGISDLVVMDDFIYDEPRPLN